jgi:hypothetical protein
MNGLEKLEFLDSIALQLQGRMTFNDIDTYFKGHGVPTQDDYPQNSKRSYSKDMLANVNDETIFKIAAELGVFGAPPSNTAPIKEVTFWKTGHFKLFLSHLATFKVPTSHLQTALRKYAISSFVAHEDIEPTKEWQQEIEAGLQTMDALAAILMPGFKESNWCDQEIGVAVGRDVLIIPIRRGLDPYGFIGKYQGIQANGKNIGEVAEAIFQTLVKSPKTQNKMLLAISGSIVNATSPEEALDKVATIKSLESIPADIFENLKVQVTDNKLLTESQDFINQLNAMLTKFKVSKLLVGAPSKQKEWDKIPF